MPTASALDRARAKAFRRLLPLLFLCYVVAYVDRTNVGLATLTMGKDLPGFDNAVFGFGSGVFFLGYFLLEVPGSLLVERWSARKWISRIMVTWGMIAGLTALVKTPTQFYLVRFFLGLAEAGFFPGVVIYLTHWFPSRDRARALALFLMASPIAQITSPKLSNLLLKYGTTEVLHGVTIHHPPLWGLHGWQWMFIAWGIPAVVLGVVVLATLTDHPARARWLDTEERDALEAELARELAERRSHQGRHMGALEALGQPKVLLLALAFFLTTTGNYGIEFFMPKILETWYRLDLDKLTWMLVIPPIGSLLGQMFIGWNSDRTGERRLHCALPILIGAVGLAGTLLSRGHLGLTIVMFTLALIGTKAHLPAFWTLPSLFLTESAAAASIGLINSVGNLGGFVGPYLLGKLQSLTGSFQRGILILSVSIALAAVTVILLGLGRRTPATPDPSQPLAEAA